MSKSVKISRVVKSSRDKKSLNKNINKSGSKTTKKKVYKKQQFKPNLRSRDWRFTINNYSDYDIANLMLMSDPDTKEYRGITYIIAGFEKGEEKETPHIQGYLELKNQVMWRSIIRWNDIDDCTHWDIEPKSKYATAEDNYNYCTGNSAGKSPNDDFFEFGTPKQQGKRNDWHNAKDILKNGGSLQDVAEKDFKTYVRFERGLRSYKQMIDKDNSHKIRKDLHVTVLWGDGGTGKTRFVYDNHDSKDIYRLRRSNNNNIWFNGYEGEPILLIDDFRGWISYTDLLEFLDIYPCPIEFKGGSTFANWTKVYITSNKHPKNWYPNVGFPYELERRLHEIKFFKNEDIPESKRVKEEDINDDDINSDYGITEGNLKLLSNEIDQDNDEFIADINEDDLKFADD